jgi:TRAP-type C4-dicarboxylate transport system substrate-binding protein
MRTTISIAALSLALGGVAGAQELQYSTHLPPSILVNSAGVIPVFEAVTEATGGEVTAKFFWAGQLYDAAGNFDAIGDGVIDAAFTQPASNQAKMPANMLFSDLYHLGGDPFVTAAAVNETILLDCPTCRAEYEAANAMFLGAHAATPSVLVCAREIGSMDDLRGLRIIGQQSVAGWVQELGSAQLDVPPPGQLEALERGTADCTTISPEWLTAISIGEAAETVVNVHDGSQFATSFMTMNKDTWAGLSD